MDDQPAGTGPASRREGRQALEFETTFETADGRKSRFVMLNISHGGFMGECDLAPPAGARLALEMPGIGRVPACVKWVMGNRIGCQLLNGLTFQQVFFVLLLSQADALACKQQAGSSLENRAA